MSAWGHHESRVVAWGALIAASLTLLVAFVAWRASESASRQSQATDRRTQRLIQQAAPRPTTRLILDRVPSRTTSFRPTDVADCRAPSEASRRDDVRMCATREHGVLDPCFENTIFGVSSGLEEVDFWCPDGLSGNGRWFRGTLEVSTPTPGGDPFSAEPWAVELANGDRCVDAGPFGSTLEEVEPTMRCRKEGRVFGSVIRDGPTWSVLYQRKFGEPFVTVDILFAHF